MLDLSCFKGVYNLTCFSKADYASTSKSLNKFMVSISDPFILSFFYEDSKIVGSYRGNSIFCFKLFSKFPPNDMKLSDRGLLLC